MSGKTPRLNSLTSLRYFAAAAVVVTHVNPLFLASPLQREATAYWYVGVSFFFMLSGFVLTWSCSWQDARPFWWNRFSRIWPLQASMMIIVYVTLWEFVTHPPDAVGWVLQSLVLQAWDPNPHVYAGGNGPTWSLSCEFFFYAMFPLLVRVVRRLGPRGLAASAVVVLALMALVPALVGPHVSASTYLWLFYYLPAYRIGEFIIGMLLARAVQLGLRFPRASAGYLLGWTWVAVWVVATTWYGRIHHDAVARPFAAELVLPGFVILVAAGASADLAGRTRLMGAWLPVKLGEWSFALYLVQDGLISVTARHLTLTKAEQLTDGGWLLVAFIAACTVVAAAAHYAIEKPAESWLRARGPGRRSARDDRRPPQVGQRPQQNQRPQESAWTGPRHRRVRGQPEPSHPPALMER